MGTVFTVHLYLSTICFVFNGFLYPLVYALFALILVDDGNTNTNTNANKN